jgi:alpha-galactosidase
MKFSRLVVRYKVGQIVKTTTLFSQNYCRNEDFIIQCYVEGDMSNYLKKIILKPKKEIELIKVWLDEVYPFETGVVFEHGFYSWTKCTEYNENSKIRRRKPNLFNYKMRKYEDHHLNYQLKQQKGLFYSHMYTYIRPYEMNNEEIQFLGSLDDTLGYTIFKIKNHKSEISIIKELAGLKVKGKIDLFYFVSMVGGKAEVIDKYKKLLHKNKSDQLSKVTYGLGWTSFTDKKENSRDWIMENLEFLNKYQVPMDLIHISEGYQSAIGDWILCKEAFTRGLKYIAEDIHAAGYKVGLWLAPFICEKKSVIYKKHKNWLLTNQAGKLVVAGFKKEWGGNFYILNIYLKEVQDYLREVFNTLLYYWKIDFLELDYLYAVNLIAYQHQSKAKIMQDALVFIKECVGNVPVLVSGVPIASVMNQVDYCRVGTDRAPMADALSNIVYRSWLNGEPFFNVTNDVILENKDSPYQKYTYMMLNHLLGTLTFFGGALKEYDLETWHHYLSVFPKQQIQVKDYLAWNQCFVMELIMKDKAYTIFVNLSNQTKEMLLKDGIYFNKEDKQIVQGNIKIYLKPYETRCYYKVEDSPIVGSFGYILPCGEIIAYYITGNHLFIEVEEGFINSSYYLIKDSAITDVTVNGQKCEIKIIEDTAFYYYKNKKEITIVK